MNPQFVLTAVESSKWYVLNATTGEQEHSIAYGTNPWSACQLSEDLVATTGDDNKITIFEIDGWNQKSQLTGHTNNSRGIRYLPHSNQLVTGSIDETIKIWDWESGSCVQTLSDPNNNTMDVEAFPEFPNIVCSGSDDNKVWVWDFVANTVLHQIQYGDDPRTLARDDVRGILFSGDDDKEIRYLDARDGYREVRRLRGHSGYIRAIAYRSQADQLVFPDQHGKVYVYDVRNDSTQMTVFDGHARDHTAYGCCDIMNLNCFVTTTWDEYVRCWDGDDWTKKWEFRDSGHDPRGVCVVYSDWSAFPGGPSLSVEDVDEEKVEALIAESTPEWMAPFKAELRAEGNVIKCCKSFLSMIPTMSDEGVVEHPDALDISAKGLLSLLAGDHTRVEGKCLLQLYDFFFKLDMKKHAFLLCQILDSVKETNVLVYLLAKAFEKYGEVGEQVEGDDLDDLLSDSDEEEGETEVKPKRSGFKSPFTLALLNTLKGRMDEITATPALARACRSRGLLGPLLTHVVAPVADHPDFAFPEAEIPSSFADLTRTHLCELLRSGKHTSVTIFVPSADGEVTKVRAHLDVLCLRNPGFMSKFKDKDTATRMVADNVVVMKDFPTNDLALRAVLESTYCGSFQVDGFADLIPLWIYTLTHDDEDLKKLVVTQLRKMSREYVKQKRLEVEVAKVLPQISEVLLGDAARMWPQLGRDKLITMRNSARTKTLAESVDRIQAQTNEKFAGIEGRLDTLQATLQQIIAIVQKQG